MTTTTPLVVCLDTIPRTLQDVDRWVLWKLVPDPKKPEKPKKVPYQATHPTNAASSTNPATWADFATTVQAYRAGGVHGIGFALGDGWAGVDLDGCRDTDGIAAWAAIWIARLATYAEVSPSGTGVKLIARAEVVKPLKLALGDHIGVEVYGAGRYFTITGHRLENCPTEPQEAQEGIDALLQHFRPVPTPPARPAASTAQPAQPVTSHSDGWRADRDKAVDYEIRRWVEAKKTTAIEQIRTATGGYHNTRFAMARLLGGVISYAPRYLSESDALAALYDAKIPDSHERAELKVITDGLRAGMSTPFPADDLPKLPTDDDPAIDNQGRARCPRCDYFLAKSKYDYPGTTTPGWYCPRCKHPMVWPVGAVDTTGTAPTAQATGSAESATPTNSQTTPTTPTNSHELPRFTVRTEGELATLPDPSWLLTDEIQRSGYHLLYGASGSGKTFFAIDRALRAVAAGARCLYIATEDLSGLKVRTAAWRAHNKGMGGALAWLDMPHGLDLSDVTQVYDLMIAITGLDLDLITIDTLREAHTGDENSSQAMAAVNRAIQQMIRETGAAVDVVHHSGVNDGRERGSTALGANCDIKWKIAGDDGGFVTVSCEKFRHGAVFSPRYYRITPTPSTEGGAVLLPVGSTTDRGDSPLTAGQRKILEMLALSIFEEQGAKSTQIERDTGMPSSSMNRALDSLKKKGFITQGSKGDPYSITPTGRTAIRPNYQLTPTNKSASQCATPTTPTNSQTTPTDLPRTPTTPTTHRVGVGGSGSEEKKDTTHPTPDPTPVSGDAPASTITRLRDGTALHTLVLTANWQEIPLDWAVPYGAETKTNKAEGLNYARLAPVATPTPEPARIEEEM